MRMEIYRKRKKIGLRMVCAALLLVCAPAIFAQTSVFTYQGKLTDGGAAANGTYDMQFKLFDAAGAGNQVGPTLTVANVPATAGIFGVQLDFGAASFAGADRFLEVAVSPAGQNNFTTLAPRQRLTSAPYAIRSATAANAFNLGGVAANQYVLTDDPRLDAGNFVRNTTVPQADVNFNIGGTGTASILNAGVQLDFGGSRILGNAGADNLFAGIGAGAANTTGPRNAFFGRNAGNANTNGSDNAFFGYNAGSKSRSFANSFFGSGAGAENANGNSLAFFGANAGNKNVTGTNNSFFGNAAGRENISGLSNTFLGFAAGLNNTTGSGNIFIGSLSGSPDAATQIDNSIAIGNNVTVSTSNTIVLGRTSQRTQIPGGLTVGSSAVSFPAGGGIAEFFNNGALSGVLIGNVFVSENGLNNILASPVHLCIRTTSIGGGFGGEALARCTTPFSSAAGKTAIEPFASGLEIVKRLKPVAFKWKADGRADVGLNAEDVAEIAPQLVVRDGPGQVEAVSESGLSLVLINAVREQQAQIEAQEKLLKRQQAQLEALRRLVCRTDSQAAVCREDR